MSLACQKDSYLSQLTSKVKSCEAATLQTVQNGKKQKLSGFEVVLCDTVLFPEGGGQPDDRGKIDDVGVLRVTRRGAEAVHFTPTPFDVDQEVHLTVDWTRRWDHMQQHSGQHLVTAIADATFGFPTTSWNLGEKISSIELDTPKLTPEHQERLEVLVNERIRACVPMYPTLYDSVHDPRLTQVRTRGLPEDHVGAVRVVTIEGIENNMCCGTHVANLAHLQAIKLLGTEKGKKGKTNLLFVAGDRVLKYLGTCYEREKTMTGYLKGNPEEHPGLLDKLQKSFKETRKNETSLLREVAKIEAQLYLLKPEKPAMHSLHRTVDVIDRKEGDVEFMNMVVNEIGDPEALLFLTTGDEKGQGMFLLAGSEPIISALAPKVMETIGGKGFCKNGKCQGKASKLNKKADAETLIRQHVDSVKQTDDGALP